MKKTIKNAISSLTAKLAALLLEARRTVAGVHLRRQRVGGDGGRNHA